MPAGIPLVVFSNLDGIVGQPAERVWSEAAAELRELERERVPLVLCSNRTRAEVEAMQQRLGLRHPLICERGAVAFVPAGYFEFTIAGSRHVAGYHAMEFGAPAAEVIGSLRRVALRQRLDVVGFSEMSVEEVAHDCRLSLLDARLAKLREYGERFRLLQTGAVARERLFRALGHGHLRSWEGDRYHDVSTAFDPMQAANVLYACFRRSFGAMLSVGATEAVGAFGTAHDAAPRPAAATPNPTLLDWAQHTNALVKRLTAQRLSVPS